VKNENFSRQIRIVWDNDSDNSQNILEATQVAVKSKFGFLMPLIIRYNKSTWSCWILSNFTTRSIALNNETLVMYIYVRIGIYHEFERILVILENNEHKVKCYSYCNIKTLCVSCNRRIANLPILINCGGKLTQKKEDDQILVYSSHHE